MKTEQFLKIDYKGMELMQTMKDDMVGINSIETAALKFTDDLRLLKNRGFSQFLIRKDTINFIDALCKEDQVERGDVIKGRGVTKRVHSLLALKYCTWINKEFEIFIYKFFLEEYPKIRELGGDKYNEFSNTLKTIYTGNSEKWIIINTNKFINKKLKKDNGGNTENKDDLEFRNYFYKNIIKDIKMGEKNNSREKIQEWINGKVLYYFNRFHI